MLVAGDAELQILVEHAHVEPVQHLAIATASNLIHTTKAVLLATQLAAGRTVLQPAQFHLSCQYPLRMSAVQPTLLQCLRYQSGRIFGLVPTFCKKHSSDVGGLVDTYSTTDWEHGTESRSRSGDMYGHDVTMERHIMTIFS